MIGGTPETYPAFFVRPPASSPESPDEVALREVREPDGRRRYTVDPDGEGQTVAWVWKNPLEVALPVGDYLGSVVAHAGPDQCVTRAPGAATATVRLNAAASRTSGTEIESHLWLGPNFTQMGTTEAVDLELEPGVHTFALVLMGTDGNADTDFLIVSVE